MPDNEELSPPYYLECELKLAGHTVQAVTEATTDLRENCLVCRHPMVATKEAPAPLNNIFNPDPPLPNVEFTIGRGQETVNKED